MPIYHTYCPPNPLFSVCLRIFGNRLQLISDKNHSSATHRCKKYKKPYLRSHVISLSRATLYIAYARVYVCVHMRRRIRACARTLIYRREVSASDFTGSSESCMTNNERCRGFCRTANKVCSLLSF